MTHYLLAISIGPVQDFIAAARRTADLYAGSQLLVEIAKTVARTIQSNGGRLIFPAVVTKNGQQEVSDGPNKIVAEIIKDKPVAVVDECRKAALKTLEDAWTNAMKSIPNGVLDETLADHQIKHFLEFYTAWLPWDGNDGTYEEVRRELDRLLAGRKALRDFQQPMTRAGRPKSPLDPSRDCALKVTGTNPVPSSCKKHPLWLKQRETLDALSLLKRVRGVVNGSEIPSTSLMAFRAIRSDVEGKASPQIHLLKEKAKKAGTGIDLGDLMFVSRSDEEELKNRGLTEDDLRAVREARSAALKAVGRSECPPYYAILVADGDKMGALIGELKDLENHRKFSAVLSKFADEAKRIVGEHDGHLVYSGGDDVLALLPVNQVLDCAAVLAGKFRSILENETDIKAVLDQLQKQGKIGGTLSVGIAIVHHMDPLLVSLEHARAAEKEAKKLRNAFAVALHTRGGEPLTTSQQWDNNYTVNDWKQWINAFRNGLARGFPYELRTLAREFQAKDMPVKRMQKEAERIYHRKEGSATLPLPDFKEDPKVMETLAKKLVITRFLSTYEVTA